MLSVFLDRKRIESGSCGFSSEVTALFQEELLTRVSKVVY